jgi:putative oxidoreductase
MNLVEKDIGRKGDEMGVGQRSHGAEGAGWRRDAGLIGPRAMLGATMLYHGVEKLRAPEQTTAQFESLGIKPAGFWARATAIAEAGAGVLTLAGWLVRPAALAVLVTQAVAIRKVHGPKGFAAHRGGYEFNLGLMATAAAMLLGGPGRYSLARLLAGRRAPRGWRAAIPARRRRRGFAATLLAALS